MTAAVVQGVPPMLKVSAAYGRLYVGGPDAALARRLPGATLNERRGTYEVSLTLTTLRALREAAGVDARTFARYCTPEVLAWAKAAGKSEEAVAEVHRRIDAGVREEFPWYDADSHWFMPGTIDPFAEPKPLKETAPDGSYSFDYRPPFDHQQVMASVAYWMDGSAFLCEMGTGKTRAGVEAMAKKLRTGQLDLMLVVCPRGAMGVWERECRKWATDLRPLRLRDTVAKRKQVLRDLTTGRIGAGAANVLILNYDVLYLMTDEIVALMKARKVGFLPDEMHRMGNSQAKVTKAGMLIAQHAAWRLGLTGTPFRKTGEEIWSQWYIVDVGIEFGANVVQYRREFFDANPWTFEVTPKPGALEEIGQRLRRRGLRYTKADCLDLPPKVPVTMELEMSPPQARAYRQMEEDLVIRFTEGEERYATAANQLVAILRLAQITGGYVPDEDGTIVRFHPNPKLDELVETVTEQAEAGHQFIVWALYTEHIRMLVEAFTRAGVTVRALQGGQTDAYRDALETEFAAGQFQGIIGQPAAGSVALNLQAANQAHYYSQSASLIDRLQSEDRCHRSGSEIHQSVTYTDWVMKDTVDVVIAKALQERKALADIVVDLKRAIGVPV